MWIFRLLVWVNEMEMVEAFTISHPANHSVTTALSCRWFGEVSVEGELDIEVGGTYYCIQYVLLLELGWDLDAMCYR